MSAGIEPQQNFDIFWNCLFFSILFNSYVLGVFSNGLFPTVQQLQKESTTEWGDINFQKGAWAPAAHKHSGLREILSRAYLSFVGVYVCDFGFDQWSVVSFVIKKLWVYYFMMKQCMYLVIQMYFMQIYFQLLWSWNKFANFVVFMNFLLTLHATWTIKESKILRRFKESR